MKKKFNKWMLYIGNIYYANDNMMSKAYQIIEEYEKV